jgi:dienelactone hydrolase
MGNIIVSEFITLDGVIEGPGWSIPFFNEAIGKFKKEREIEDLQALLEDAGDQAMVFGISSGGVLSLDAATVAPGITKVVVYEPSLIVDDSRQPMPADYTEHLTTLAAEGMYIR